MKAEIRSTPSPVPDHGPTPADAPQSPAAFVDVDPRAIGGPLPSTPSSETFTPLIEARLAEPVSSPVVLAARSDRPQIRGNVDGKNEPTQDASSADGGNNNDNPPPPNRPSASAGEPSDESDNSIRARRERQIATYNQILETLRLREQSAETDNPWGQTDAGLVTGEHSLQEWFGPTLPRRETNIQLYIERELRDTEHRTALEIGGTGSKLFGEFEEGFFDQTVAVNLTDYRSPEMKTSDAARNHTVIPGNAFDPEKQQEVAAQTQSGDGKFDVVFERMYAGSQILPKEPFFLGKQADVYYRMTRSLLFAEIPPAFEEHLRAWERHIKQHYKGQLEIKTAQITIPNEERTVHVLRLKKLPGAPEALPLLDPRTIVRQQRGIRS